MTAERSGRAGSPITSPGLSVEDALRRAMQVPAPAASTPKPEKKQAKKKPKKPGKKP